MSKKDKAQNRDLYIKVRVNQAEMNLIKRKFRESGMQTLSGFVRAMIFEGYIVQMDGNELQQIHKLASNIASSINQIAVRVNSTGRTYDNDIAEYFYNKKCCQECSRQLLVQIYLYSLSADLPHSK